MYKIINLKQLIPKEWGIEHLNKDKMKVSYKNIGRGNNPKSFALPTYLLVDKILIEGLALYIGDGKLSKDTYHLEFTSKDKDLLKFMFGFFKDKFYVKNRDFIFREQAFQISGVILRVIIGKVIEEIYKSDFYKNEGLRRAFLRGLFAAEGGIGLVKKENYIAYVAFHLSYVKEEKLANFVQYLLKLERISSKQITRETKGERYIQITSWKNYSKCWKIGLFDICGRKRRVFSDKLYNTKFNCKLDGEIKKKLMLTPGLTQRQLALRIGVSPPLICCLKKKGTYLGIEHIIKLSEIAKIPLETIKKHIEDFRVNNQTKIKDREFIDFVFGLKRAEQQALAAHGLNFVISDYLPKKLGNPKSWLP